MLKTLPLAAVLAGLFAGPALDVRQNQASGYTRPELLVDADWVAAHHTDAGVRIVDLRPNGYAAAHIPGAVHLANAAIRDPKNPPSFVPTPRDFETLIGGLGISNRTRVVAYDERGGIYAARLWWILNYYGHSNVALLDGGWTKWSKEGRETTAAAPAVRPATFAARAMPAWLAGAQDVVEAIKNPSVRIIDARTPAEIEGRDLRGIKRGGAIPGSIPVYWEDGLTAERTFKSARELRDLFESRGVRPDHDVIAYCQVGMRASVDLFMLRLIGYDRLRNYYGSWEEWGNRDDLPIKK